jgi:chromosome segregation ATPase
VFTLLLAQAADTGGPGSSNLLGIAAIIAAVVPIVLAVLNYALKRGNGDTAATASAIEDARERVELLKADRDDLSARLEQCRADRQVRDAEARVKDMMIGDLTGRLSEANRALERAEQTLARALKARDDPAD